MDFFMNTELVNISAIQLLIKKVNDSTLSSEVENLQTLSTLVTEYNTLIISEIVTLKIKTKQFEKDPQYKVGKYIFDVNYAEIKQRLSVLEGLKDTIDKLTMIRLGIAKYSKQYNH
jgi:hypothetical protein